MDPPGLKNHTLMLADTESEKSKWVVALSELHRILKRNNLPNTTVSFYLFMMSICNGDSYKLKLWSLNKYILFAFQIFLVKKLYNENYSLREI